jgi:hypothetical protein
VFKEFDNFQLMQTTNVIPSALKEKFWLVSADMGYGHQRAIYPLKFLSKDGIILNANMSPYASLKERRLWKDMLREIGAGIKQQDPEYANQWLLDLLDRGRLAEAAWNGFLKARKYGTYNIIDFLESGSFTSSNDPLKR